MKIEWIILAAVGIVALIALENRTAAQSAVTAIGTFNPQPLFAGSTYVGYNPAIVNLTPFSDAAVFANHSLPVA